MDIDKAYQLITQKLLSWLHDLVRMLPNLLLAVIVFVLGLYLARWLKKIPANLIARIFDNSSQNNLFVSVIYIFFFGVSSTAQPDFLRVASEAIKRIKKAYDENDILIPFPIRTLNFRIKASVSLNNVHLNGAAK